MWIASRSVFEFTRAFKAHPSVTSPRCVPVDCLPPSAPSSHLADRAIHVHRSTSSRRDAGRTSILFTTLPTPLTSCTARSAFSLRPSLSTCPDNMTVDPPYLGNSRSPKRLLCNGSPASLLVSRTIRIYPAAFDHTHLCSCACTAPASSSVAYTVRPTRFR